MIDNLLLSVIAGAGVVGVIVAFYALHLSIQTQIRIGAFEKSTHNVQYVPLEQMPGYQPEPDGTDDDDNKKKLKRAEQAGWDSLNDIDELNQGGTIPLD